LSRWNRGTEWPTEPRRTRPWSQSRRSDTSAKHWCAHSCGNTPLECGDGDPLLTRSMVVPGMVFADEKQPERPRCEDLADTTRPTKIPCASPRCQLRGRVACGVRALHWFRATVGSEEDSRAEACAERCRSTQSRGGGSGWWCQSDPWCRSTLSCLPVFPRLPPSSPVFPAPLRLCARTLVS